MQIIGHVCKTVCGWAVGETANTALALRAMMRINLTYLWDAELPRSLKKNPEGGMDYD
jgi:hypothetical protein